jgi:hypothetical protein
MKRKLTFYEDVHIKTKLVLSINYVKLYVYFDTYLSRREVGN